MIGVILHYYGSPQTPQDVEDFYASIIHRPPTEEQVDKLIGGYEAYGRPGPLGATVERLQTFLERRLNENTARQTVVDRAGKHSPPPVEDVVASMLEKGVTRFVSLPLTPFGSRLGTDNYHRSVRKALERHTQKSGGRSTGESDRAVVTVDRWYARDGFVDACALRLRQAMAWLPEGERANAKVVFTTHSMPREEKQAGLSLHEQYDIWARRTAQAAAVDRWVLSYRSAPGGADHWLGPDILDVMRDVANDGYEAVVVCPLPTLIENVEVFEEAGMDAQSVATDLGLMFVRTELLNDAADMVDVLEDLVVDALEEN